jgi:preprotein translocase SecE subunit
MAKDTTAATGGGGGFFARPIGFYYEVRNELSKVAWPSKDDLKSSTSVVLVLLIIMAAGVGVVDLILQWIMVSILQLA